MFAKKQLTSHFPLLLTSLVTLEILAQTYGFLWGFPAVSSLLYCLAGLGVALLPMARWKTVVRHKGAWWHYLALAGLILLLLWCCWRAAALFAVTPLDFRQADMLPVIRTMGQRWWAGEAVYTPIPEIWEGMRPIYLPAMWLPFSLGLLLKIDIRWIGVLLLMISLLLTFPVILQREYRQRSWLSLAGLAPVLLLCLYIFGLYSTLITLTEEPVVVFYYILLAWSMFRQRHGLTGVAIALCLLSRYTLAFWVPVYLVFLFFYRSRRAAGTTFVSMALSTLLLLTIGQAWDQLLFFLQLQQSYLQELLNEGRRWAVVASIEGNPGLIKFLPYDHIALWHRLLVIGSALIPWLSLGLFRQYRQGLDRRFFGLCSLKLTLVYFFSMLTLPYSYLFYPSSFLSLFILFAALKTKTKIDAISTI